MLLKPLLPLLNTVRNEILISSSQQRVPCSSSLLLFTCVCMAHTRVPTYTHTHTHRTQTNLEHNYKRAASKHFCMHVARTGRSLCLLPSRSLPFPIPLCLCLACPSVLVTFTLCCRRLCYALAALIR